MIVEFPHGEHLDLEQKTAPPLLLCSWFLFVGGSRTGRASLRLFSSPPSHRGTVVATFVSHYRPRAVTLFLASSEKLGLVPLLRALASRFGTLVTNPSALARRFGNIFRCFGVALRHFGVSLWHKNINNKNNSDLCSYPTT